MKLLVASVLAACLLKPSLSWADEPVSIGLILELSGPSAAIGQLCKGGYETALSVGAHNGKTAGRTIKLVYGDSAGSPAAALSEFHRLVEVEKVSAVISTTSALTAPLNPLSKQAKVPLLSRASYARLLEDNPYAYRFWPDSMRVGKFLAEQIIARGEKSIAVLTFEDEFNLTMEMGLTQALKDSAVQIPYAEHVSSIDATGPVAAAKIISSKATSVFVNLSYSTTGLFIRKLRESGFTGQIYGLVWLSVPDVLRQTGPDAAAGAIYVDIDYLKPAFVEAFRKQNPHSDPNNAGYACFLELTTILEAVKRSPNFTSPEELNAAIVKLGKLPTLDGEVSLVGREVVFDLVSRKVPNHYLQTSVH